MNAVPMWAWTSTVAVIGTLLALDTLVGKAADGRGLRGALVASSLWVAVSVLFGLVLAWALGAGASAQYFSGYVLEKSLSVDNVLAIALLMRSMEVPLELQRGLLRWGVVGALVLRGALIAGGGFIDHLSWAFCAFGALLVVAGARMAYRKAEMSGGPSLALRALRRVLPVSSAFAGNRFFTRRKGRFTATRLLVALVAIESTDLVFATDSIPAIFGVTTDLFIVFTSNAFAVLGLRALYFVLAEAMTRFAYLSKGLAALLVLIGVKMLVQPIVYVPTLITVATVLAVLSAAIGASIVSARDETPAQPELQ